MAGVLRAFVDGALGVETGAHLLLVGPDVAGVTDDPEGRQVLDECVAMWEQLPAETLVVDRPFLDAAVVLLIEARGEPVPTEAVEPA